MLHTPFFILLLHICCNLFTNIHDGEPLVLVPWNGTTMDANGDVNNDNNRENQV